MRSARSRLALAVAVAAAVACGGCSARCRPGTALVTVELTGSAAQADAIAVAAELAGGVPMQRTFAWSGGDAATLELQFPSGYPAGAGVDVQVSALRRGVPVGVGEDHEVLRPGCSTLRVVVAGGVGGGGAIDDGGASDDDGGAAAPDLAAPGGDPCAATGSDGVVCAPANGPCQRAGVCQGGRCGPVTQLPDGTAVPGGQYIDRCCAGQAVKLDSDDNCGGCGIHCMHGFHCNDTGATNERMWWCGCNNNSDCWSNCCGTGSTPNTAAKACSPSSCGTVALCQGCPLHETCEMSDPHYYCHY